MPPKNSKNNSVNKTLHFLSEFEAKKNFFEYNIRQLKLFQPSDAIDSVKTPNETGKRFTRCRLNNNDLTVPSPSPNAKNSSSETSDDISKFLVEQLQYLFETNHNLIEIIKELQSSYETIKTEFKEISDNYILMQNENKFLAHQVGEMRNTVENEKINRVTSERTNEAMTQSKSDANNITLNNRIVSLEQQSSNNDVILQGEKIQNLIANTTPNTSIHEAVIFTLSTTMPNLINNDDLQNISSVHIVGSTKKTLRLKMVDSISKVKLIRSIKVKRQNGLFASEFLVPERRRLFHAARHLLKTHRNKLKNVYTRDGIV